MTARKWIWLLAAALPAGAFAQATAARDSVLATAEHSSLSNGSPDWNEYAVHWIRDFGNRRVMDASIARTSRFGLHDTQASVNYATPLTPALGLALEATVSGTHKVLPRYALGGELQYEFAPAWLVHGGLKHTRYEGQDVDRGLLQLEHYFGNFSASVTGSHVRTVGTSANGVELRGAWYYREGSNVGVIASRGDEATVIAPGVVTLAAVRSVALLGKHELRPGLALTWSLFRSRQGSFYTREGASAGVQVAF